MKAVTCFSKALNARSLLNFSIILPYTARVRRTHLSIYPNYNSIKPTQMPCQAQHQEGVHTPGTTAPNITLVSGWVGDTTNNLPPVQPSTGTRIYWHHSYSSTNSKLMRSSCKRFRTTVPPINIPSIHERETVGWGPRSPCLCSCCLSVNLSREVCKHKRLHSASIPEKCMQDTVCVCVVVVEHVGGSSAAQVADSK